MTTKYERPILTTVFYVLGVLSIVGATLCAFINLVTAITVALAGIIYIGIGEAVDYLARTAHSTDRICTILEISADRLKSIESSLALSNATSSQPTKGYYFSTDGQQQGPVAAADLRNMRKDGLITDDTPVLREGDSQWRVYRDFLALTR